MADARRMMAETGCQSVMVGRGALGRPWVFDEAYDALPPMARHAYRTRVIARHVALIQDHCDERYALVQIKKHLSWYTDGLGHARECRVAIFQARAGGRGVGDLPALHGAGGARARAGARGRHRVTRRPAGGDR